MIGREYYVKMAKERSAAAAQFFVRADHFPQNVDKIVANFHYDDGLVLELEVSMFHESPPGFWRKLLAKLGLKIFLGSRRKLIVPTQEDFEEEEDEQ